jgi:N-acetyltransferase 10
MVKKKVDSRVKLVVENAIRRRHRSFIVLVGDRGRDQVVNLHYMLSKARVKTRPSVLWCYKKDLGFSTHRKKRMRQVKKLISRGLYDPDKENPFDLFVSSTDIRYCYYKDSHKVLGSTYGMVVLQDFAALTPNLLCRVIETVEGGGLIVLLLQTMTSLKQLYTMTMDVHSRFRTESYADVVPRFNERFILSLSSCATCLVCDDELNVLTISSTSHGITKDLTGGADGEDEDGDVGAAVETIDAQLEELQATLKEQHADEPVARLVGKCLTHDQARAVMTFTEALQEKSLRGTVALTAARGRGKSAALGFAIAGAIAHGYANIFVTAPSPENLGTMWEFVVRGLEALDYVDHTDYEIVKSTNKELSHCVVRLNVFRTHRQTVQYVRPQDASSIAAHAELVCIDEAAAIPLPIVRGLLGPFLVFLTSTVTGYEGTGRALSLKLIKQLRPGRKKVSKAKGKKKRREESNVHSGRTLKEITLRHPIRYVASSFGLAAGMPAHFLLFLFGLFPFLLTKSSLPPLLSSPPPLPLSPSPQVRRWRPRRSVAAQAALPRRDEPRARACDAHRGAGLRAERGSALPHHGGAAAPAGV